jgi:hypothetical protein
LFEHCFYRLEQKNLPQTGTIVSIIAVRLVAKKSRKDSPQTSGTVFQLPPTSCDHTTITKHPQPAQLPRQKNFGWSRLIYDAQATSTLSTIALRTVAIEPLATSFRIRSCSIIPPIAFRLSCEYKKKNPAAPRLINVREWIMASLTKRQHAGKVRTRV